VKNTRECGGLRVENGDVRVLTRGFGLC